MLTVAGKPRERKLPVCEFAQCDVVVESRVDLAALQ
jgi:hypothetical protein